jgi:neutral ceramidase
MPLLPYHSALPLDLWDLLHSPFRAMNGFVWYLTAFLASTSVFGGNGVQVGAAQYLLGLGESFDTCIES